MLQFLRNKYPRLSQSLEAGVREGFEQLSALQKELRKERPEPIERDRRRKKRSPSRAPLSEQGFSDEDELDFRQESGAKVFGRKARNGKLGTLPGQHAPVTATLPATKLALTGVRDEVPLEVTNETDRLVLVRAWVPLPDQERWRGERLPRTDRSAILGDYTRALAPGEALAWATPPSGAVLTFHEAGGRPAKIRTASDDGSVVLRAMDVDEGTAQQAGAGRSSEPAGAAAERSGPDQCTNRRKGQRLTVPTFVLP